MTTFLLIRHAAHDLLGRVLAGRAPDVHLNARGKMEAERLAGRLARLPVAALFMGPLERAQETAWPLAEGLRLDPRIEPAFDEIDFGAWTSRTFAELEGDAEWRRWNTARSEGQPPGGETMAAVQTRFVQALERLRGLYPDAVVAVVSHGDAIKAALMHYLGVPLDYIARLEVYPASLSRLVLGEGFHQVISINDTGGAP
jgi:probable phosphoglycerate mutase